MTLPNIVEIYPQRKVSNKIGILPTKKSAALYVVEQFVVVYSSIDT